MATLVAWAGAVMEKVIGAFGLEQEAQKRSKTLKK